LGDYLWMHLAGMLEADRLLFPQNSTRERENRTQRLFRRQWQLSQREDGIRSDGLALRVPCNPGATRICKVHGSSPSRIPSDEDISTILPLITEDDDAKIHDTNEIRIGPITRARAKLLNQQVNSFLVGSGILLNENCILPKSLHLCLIRFEEGYGVE
jgi:hypothetical protein